MADPDAAVHVLIAEDSATQAALLSSILEEEGFIVARARDGREGAELFDGGAFDVVISDIVMPGMDGFELCRHVKRSAAGRRIPCILLTAMQDPMDIARGLESGADNFITKPYDPAELIGKVRGVLEAAAANARPGASGVEDRTQMIGLLVGAFEAAARKGAELEARNVELRATKAELEESRSRLQMEHEKVLDAAGEGIVGLDAAGLITLVNPSAARALGWEARALIGQNVHAAFFRSRVDGSAFPSEGSPVALVLGGHQPYERAEAVFWRKDGSSFPVEHTSTPMSGEQGEVSGAVLAFRDISEQKKAEGERVKLEAQFRQSQKMDAIGRLAGGVAHDFNNLLTVIIGFAELLLANPPDTGVDRKRVRQIREAAEFAAHLTRQLLAFSRQQPLSRTAITLGDVVLGIEPMLSRLVGENIKVRTELDPTAGWVMGDAGQIGQVIMNLAVNARDAMPEGGTILVKVANAEPGDDPEAPPPLIAGPHVRLSVRDNGTGMSAATKARLFEPFFTTKAPGSGTGLGLSTVFGIVRQNGGVLSVHSAPGGGTTIHVYLPVIERPAAVAARNGAAVATAPRKHATILVVEDQNEIRELVREVLAADGHRVFVAATPEEAIEQAAMPVNRIDLLLTDMIMPGMSGLELATVLQGKLPALRLLLMSGFTVQGQGSVPAEAFIQKPFPPRALTDKIQSVLLAPAYHPILPAANGEAAVEPRSAISA